MFLSYKLHSNKKLRVLITDCTVAMAKCYAIIIITALTVKIGCEVVCSNSKSKKMQKTFVSYTWDFFDAPLQLCGTKTTQHLDKPAQCHLL